MARGTATHAWLPAIEAASSALWSHKYLNRILNYLPDRSLRLPQPLAGCCSATAVGCRCHCHCRLWIYIYPAEFSVETLLLFMASFIKVAPLSPIVASMQTIRHCEANPEIYRFDTNPDLWSETEFRRGNQLRLSDPFFQLFARGRTPKLLSVINAREESWSNDSGN